MLYLKPVMLNIQTSLIFNKISFGKLLDSVTFALRNREIAGCSQRVWWRLKNRLLCI